MNGLRNSRSRAAKLAPTRAGEPAAREARLDAEAMDVDDADASGGGAEAAKPLAPTTPVSEPDSSSPLNSAVSSVESARDRTHLTLDFNGGMKPRSHHNSSSSGQRASAAAPAPKLNSSKAVAVADSTISPMSLPKDLIDSIIMTPEKFLSLPSSLLVAAAVAQHQQQLQQQQQQTVAETPTPTKLIYPKHVTKAQESFAEGFQKALQKVQSEHKSVAPNQQQPACSPTTFKYLLSLLSTPTPTVAQKPIVSTAAGPDTSASAYVSSTTAAAASALISIANSGKEVPPPPPKIVVSSSGGGDLPTPQRDPSAQVSPSQPKTLTEELLAELSKLSKLDPNNAQSYMDLFHHGGQQVPHHMAQQQHQQQQQFPAGFQPQPTSTSSAAAVFSHSPPPLTHNQQQQNNNGYAPTMVKQEGVNGFHPQALINSAIGVVGRSAIAGRHSSRHSRQHAPLNGGVGAQALMGGGGEGSSHGGGLLDAYGLPMSHRNGENAFNMDDQDRKKLERKRARNRMAASKCRQRKMDRIQELELQVQEERQRGANLQLEMEQLQHTVRELNQLMERHRAAGCALGTTNGMFKQQQ